LCQNKHRFVAKFVNEIINYTRIAQKYSAMYNQKVFPFDTITKTKVILEQSHFIASITEVAPPSLEILVQLLSCGV